jgi:lysophospholipase L1-like esterase
MRILPTTLFCLCTVLPMPMLAQAQQQSAISLELPATNETLPGVGPVRRYDWFTNLWNAKRTEWSKRVAADKGAVVFLGDSITQGWEENFKGMLPGIKAANRGISGDTTRGMLFRLKEDVIKLNPAAVVMLMGTNDLEEKAEPEQVRDNVKLIIEQLNKHNSQLPIVLCKVFPSSETKSRPADKIQRINQLLSELVANNSQVTLVDTWTDFADDQGNAKLAEFPDLLHPNDAGYQKWSAKLIPVLSNLGLMGLVKSTNDLKSWRFEEHVDGKGTMKVEGDRIVFETIKKGTENWHIQVYQVGLDLQEGQTYELSFTAQSEAGRTILVSGMIDEEDWHSIGLFEETYVGKRPEMFSYTFTASDIRPKNNRVGFVLGDDTGSVSISNFWLRKK